MTAQTLALNTIAQLRVLASSAEKEGRTKDASALRDSITSVESLAKKLQQEQQRTQAVEDWARHWKSLAKGRGGSDALRDTLAPDLGL